MYRLQPITPELSTLHEPLVAAIAAFLRPELYVELGANGGSTFRAAIPFVGRGIAVDIEPYEHLFEGIPNGQFVRGDTLAFLRGLDAECIDLCFLDSSHDMDATIAEFEELVRTMRANGVVLFHDSYPANEAYTSPGACGRVCDAIPLLKSRFAAIFEFATLPAQHGLTIARKNLGRQLLWREGEVSPS